MTKNKTVFFCVLIIFGFFGGCKSAPTSNQEHSNAIISSKNVIQINMVGHWLGEGKREKLLLEFIKEFEFRNQEKTVKLTFPEKLYKGEKAEEEFIINQITKPIADYDIIRLKSHYASIARKLNDENWGSKYLENFYNIPHYKERHIPSLDFETLKKRTGDICVSPCIEGNYETIFANLTLAKKIGIDVKQYGMTYDDLLSYIKALDNYNKTNKTSIIAIFENDDSGWLTSETIFKRLFFSLLDGYNEINDPKYSERKLSALAQTYKAYEELSKYNPIQKNKNRLKIDWGRDNDYPLKDSCLFFVNGLYMYNIWDGKDNQALTKILPCELPVFKPSDSYMGDFSSTWCVPKNAPHKEEAIQLLMSFCRPIMAEKWVRYTKCPSGIRGNLTTTSFGIDAFEDFQYTINKKYNSKLVASADFRFITGENNNIPLNSTLVLGGLIGADEAMRNIKKQLKRN